MGGPWNRFRLLVLNKVLTARLATLVQRRHRSCSRYGDERKVKEVSGYGVSRAERGRVIYVGTTKRAKVQM